MTMGFRDIPMGGATSSLPESAHRFAGNGDVAPPKAGNEDVAPPVRAYPSHNSVIEYRDNRPIILFVTVCVSGKGQRGRCPSQRGKCGQRGRCPSLDNDFAHRCIVEAWRKANAWLVGRYVIMPDHVHFFCAPGTFPTCPFQRWMGYWKRLVAQSYKIPPVGGATSPLPEITAHNTIFQRDQWDTQLRAGDSYAQKWEYVRENPVRKGLAATSEEWPYQGELNVLQWHEG